MQYVIKGGLKYKNKCRREWHMEAFEPRSADICLWGASPIHTISEEVQKGELLARAEDGFCVYSSLTGKINDISENFIKVEGSIKGETKPLSKKYTGGFSASSKNELMEYFLLTGHPEARVMVSGGYEKVIISCMGRVSSEDGEKIIAGAKILLLLLGIRNAVIAVEKDNKKLARAIEGQKYDRNMFLIAMLPKVYPLERDEVMARAIYPYTPADKIYVVDAAACISAAECIVNALPYVGHKVRLIYKKRYRDVFCPSGTPIRELKRYGAIGINKKEENISLSFGVSGVGKIYHEENSVLGDDISAIVFSAEKGTAQRDGVCISCRKCREVCPMELSPYIIASGACTSGAEKCISCGACTHSCPAGIDLCGKIRHLNKEGQDE